MKKAKQKIPRITGTAEMNMPVRFVFTDPERLELSRDLVSKMTTYQSIEDQAKTIAADYKAKLKLVESEVSVLQNKLSNGYEYREAPVVVHYNTCTDAKGKAIPRPGFKRIVRKDNGELVKDEPMSPSDLNAELFQQQEMERKKKDPEPKGLNTPVIPESGSASTAAKS